MRLGRSCPGLGRARKMFILRQTSDEARQPHARAGSHARAISPSQSYSLNPASLPSPSPKDIHDRTQFFR